MQTVPESRLPAKAERSGSVASAESASTRAVSESTVSDEPGSPHSQSRSCAGSVIVFDWDDTLLPTSRFKEGTPASQAQLEAHARLVERVLRAAHAVGHVAIVTLSKNQWVTRSADRFLPSLQLASLLRELDIPVYYAMEEPCPSALVDMDWERLKRISMGRCVRHWQSVGAFKGSELASILSIGDSHVEHRAIKGFLASREAAQLFGKSTRPVCKTVKLMESPSFASISEELQKLQPQLARLARWHMNLEVVVDEPERLDCLHL